jgi:molybdopterin synthase catalytic subunit
VTPQRSTAGERVYDDVVATAPAANADDWLALLDTPVPVADAVAWAVRPDCGAVVLFCGTVRDHAEGRPNVSLLTYEAYEEEVGPRLEVVADDVRRRWPAVRRLAILHRVGSLEVGEVSVAIVASSPHRAEAFAAARYAIDTVKTAVPIWKRETWEGGEEWSACSHDIDDIQELAGQS